MKKIIVLALAAVVLSALITGCAEQEAAPSGDGEAAQVDGTEITDDISGVEELDTELDTTELDSIDQELTELDNLFS